MLYYKDVVGIGNYAVMTMDGSKLTFIDDPETISSMEKDSCTLIGEQLITITGDVLGTVIDFEFNEQSGYIEKIIGEKKDAPKENTENPDSAETQEDSNKLEFSVEKIISIRCV